MLFIDEVDSIASQRKPGEHEATSRIKNQILVGMSAIKDDDVFVVAATNLPWTLDDAFLRRFDRDIYIPLPSEADRAKLFSLYLRDVTSPLLTDLEFHVFSTLTDKFSGDDIRKVCETIARFPGTKLYGPIWFQWTERGKWQQITLPGGVFAPCTACETLELNPDKPKLQECPKCHCVLGMWDWVPDHLRDPSFTTVEEAYNIVATSRSTAPSAENLAKYAQWHSR